MLKDGSRLLRFLLAWALLGAMLGYALVAAAEQRVALVIGNDAYPAAPLRNPVNDARAIAKSLNQLGFQVLLKTNLNLQATVEAVRELGARVKEGDVALFYYSGHGMQVKGRNFLIPVNADIRGEHEVPYLSLDVSQVLDTLEFSRSRVNIVILDACRNNPYIRSFRSARVGLAQMDAPGGTLIAFSTAPGSEARDGDAEYGTYTRHLMAHLTTPGLPVEIMFRRVREGVTTETKDRQVPWESSSLKGDFYFNPAVQKPALAAPAPAPAPATVTIQQVDPVTVELALWDSIKTSTNRADFEAYLEKYPNGTFSGVARNRIKTIQQETLASASAPPARAVTSGKSSAEIEKSQQSEKERSELLKSLEDERKRRDRDAEAVKQEMEKLRAELLKLREDSAPPRPPVQASVPVSATPTIAAPKPSGSPPEQRPQVAIASPAASSAVASASPSTAEWAQRVALLEKSRGQLTFSKAVAILLDINRAEELSLLLTHEGEVKRKSWHNAYAMGTDNKGNLIWGGGYGLRIAVDAAQTALEQCVSRTGDSCKVIMVNGEFREKAFMEITKQLGVNNVVAVRQAYLQSLTKNPTESKVGLAIGISGGASGAEFNYSIGYSSIRE